MSPSALYYAAISAWSAALHGPTVGIVGRRIHWLRDVQVGHLAAEITTMRAVPDEHESRIGRVLEVIPDPDGARGDTIVTIACHDGHVVTWRNACLIRVVETAADLRAFRNPGE